MNELNDFSGGRQQSYVDYTKGAVETYRKGMAIEKWELLPVGAMVSTLADEDTDSYEWMSEETRYVDEPARVELQWLGKGDYLGLTPLYFFEFGGDIIGVVESGIETQQYSYEKMGNEIKRYQTQTFDISTNTPSDEIAKHMIYLGTNITIIDVAKNDRYAFDPEGKYEMFLNLETGELWKFVEGAFEACCDEKPSLFREDFGS